MSNNDVFMGSEQIDKTPPGSEEKKENLDDNPIPEEESKIKGIVKKYSIFSTNYAWYGLICIWAGAIIWLVVSSALVYLFGVNQRTSNDYALFFGMMTFLVLLAGIAIKKGWLKKDDKEKTPDNDRN